jgi:hypothetical protein
MQALAGIPMEQWPAAKLTPSPALRLVRARYPVNDYFAAVKEGREPPVPAAEASATAVYRSGLTVWRMGLTPPMVAVLSALVAGEALEAALAHAGDAAPEHVMSWFREWVQSGLFVGVVA